MANKNDNKSLFIYTSLIFAVAVLLIILSFFGQTNMQKNQPEIEDTSSASISERASVLSEENKTLLEENNSLKNTVTELTEQKTSLENENKSLTEYQYINELLLSANGYYTLGNDSKALEILNTINPDNLTGDQQILYNTLKNNL